MFRVSDRVQAVQYMCLLVSEQLFQLLLTSAIVLQQLLLHTVSRMPSFRDSFVAISLGVVTGWWIW